MSVFNAHDWWIYSIYHHEVKSGVVRVSAHARCCCHYLVSNLLLHVWGALLRRVAFGRGRLVLRRLQLEWNRTRISHHNVCTTLWWYLFHTCLVHLAKKWPLACRKSEHRNFEVDHVTFLVALPPATYYSHLRMPNIHQGVLTKKGNSNSGDKHRKVM